MRHLRVGVDVGGTFTDLVAVDDAGQVFHWKVPTTPEDQSVGVMEALRCLLDRVRALPSDVKLFVHGTTVATNTLLERKGARVGLLMTRGFRDVLHIGRQDRPRLYDLHVRRAEPIVPRRFRLEVNERTLYTGEVEVPVDPEEVRNHLRILLDAGIESIAVCYLHSYANPANECLTAEVIRRWGPRVHVSVSSEILPEMREFERTTTTVLNAYVQPAVGRYVESLSTRLTEAGVPAGLLVMRSNGGAIAASQAQGQAVQTLLSGPAGGVLGAVYLAEVTGTPNFITADVGGTSFDVSVIDNGTPTTAVEGNVGGYPVRMPRIDIHTVGAGGGSIAWVDRGGALRVGPDSAGADPGPICYGRGGLKPTVTDAHAVLGRLRTLLGGEISLDVDAARTGIAREIGDPLGISAVQAAEGILRVVNAAMTRAIRVVTVERGVDPRRYVLLAFGGAGPLHATDLARSLGIAEVLIPVAPGNFSALGLLAAPVREDRVRAFNARADVVRPDRIRAVLSALEREAGGVLQAQGFSHEAIRFECSADLRYVGQAYELTVRLIDADNVTENSWRQTVEAYHDMHRRLYGFARIGNPVEVVNLRVTALVDLGRPKWPRHSGQRARAVPTTHRLVWFEGRELNCPIFQRDTLAPEQYCEGPAIIEEPGATTVVAPGDTATVDPWGNLRITIGGGAE
jgi:N-methylhydantoinase A